MHKSVKALCLGCPTCHFYLYLSQLPREHFRGAPLKVADHSNMLARSVTAFCLVLNLHTSGVSKGMSSFFPRTQHRAGTARTRTRNLLIPWESVYNFTTIALKNIPNEPSACSLHCIGTFFLLQSATGLTYTILLLQGSV